MRNLSSRAADYILVTIVAVVIAYAFIVPVVKGTVAGFNRTSALLQARNGK